MLLGYSVSPGKRIKDDQATEDSDGDCYGETWGSGDRGKRVAEGILTYNWDYERLRWPIPR